MDMLKKTLKEATATVSAVNHNAPPNAAHGQYPPNQQYPQQPGQYPQQPGQYQQQPGQYQQQPGQFQQQPGQYAPQQYQAQPGQYPHQSPMASPPIPGAQYQAVPGQSTVPGMPAPGVYSPPPANQAYAGQPPMHGAPPAGVNPHAGPDDEGVVVETMGNGATVRKHADGHKSTRYPEGRIEHKYHDGSTKTIYPDGQVQFYTPTVAKEDYVDKAFAMGAKKFGLHLSRDKQEKITDKGRGLFEKYTGKKVSAKISN